MSGKRHHTIPQLLLRGFASEKRGDQYKLHVYSVDRPKRHDNVKNVSVIQHFYGRPEESNLDDQITSLEDEYAPFVQLLASQTNDGEELNSSKVCGLITHLNIRTKQVRGFGIIAGELIFDTVIKFALQEGVLEALILKELSVPSDFRESLTSKLIASGIGAPVAETVLSTSNAVLPNLVKQLVNEQLPALTDLMSEYVSLAKALLPDAVRLSFIETMAKDLIPEARVEQLARYRFFLHHSTHPLILGDSVCVFETRGRRQFTPFVTRDDDVVQVYMPISANRAIVGRQGKGVEDCDLSKWNLVVSRCSEEYFVSSTELSVDSKLIQDIGDWKGVLDKRQLEQLKRRMKISLEEDIRKSAKELKRISKAKP